MKRGITIGMLAIMSLLLFTGCAMTKARFSLVDLDLRNKDQIESGKVEAAIPFENTNAPAPTNAPVASAQSIPESVWGMIIDLIKVVNGRLRIVSVEYFHATAENK